MYMRGKDGWGQHGEHRACCRAIPQPSVMHTTFTLESPNRTVEPGSWGRGETECTCGGRMDGDSTIVTPNRERYGYPSDQCTLGINRLSQLPWQPGYGVPTLVRHRT
jgi:hypothetical protein